MSQCRNAPKIPLLTTSVSIVLRGGFANIPRAHLRSRYERFCPLGVFDVEGFSSQVYVSLYEQRRESEDKMSQ